jgi:uncharacterized membrane protein
VVVAVVIPGEYHNVTRALLGWNVAVWLYLVLVAWMMSRADHARLHRTAMAQAEGAAAMLTVVVLAAMVSLAGIVIELTAAKVPGTAHAWPHLAFALSTVVGSWLLVPTKFAQTYASAYYSRGGDPGLRFPESGAGFKPDYGDFIYFAFTIAVASQTADVVVATRSMRRLVLLQSLVSFAFNTAILAFTINVAASMF